jgi:hypothetical protein
MQQQFWSFRSDLAGVTDGVLCGSGALFRWNGAAFMALMETV